jgi:WD40 repeat protein
LDAVTLLAWSPDGATLATATSDDQILLWDMARREVFAGPLQGHDDTITALFFDPTSTTLTSVSNDGVLRNWDVDTKSWHDRACRLARRNLSDEERRRYLPWVKATDSCK